MANNILITRNKGIQKQEILLLEFCKNTQKQKGDQREQTMSTMLTQQSTCFCCWDDLSYGLNTLGPLCLWQCFSYECSPKPRVLLLLDDRKGVGLGSGGAGGRINDDVRSPFGPISWRKSSQQFPRHARCRWPCENLFCSFRKAHGGMPGSIRYHQQPSKTHRKHPLTRTGSQDWYCHTLMEISVTQPQKIDF